jgi:hypothetical protein
MLMRGTKPLATVLSRRRLTWLVGGGLFLLILALSTVWQSVQAQATPAVSSGPSVASLTATSTTISWRTNVPTVDEWQICRADGASCLSRRSAAGGGSSLPGGPPEPSEFHQAATLFELTAGTDYVLTIYTGVDRSTPVITRFPFTTEAAAPPAAPPPEPEPEPEPECSVAKPCPAGEQCGSDGTCAAIPGYCATDSDCAAEQVCVDNRCVAKPLPPPVVEPEDPVEPPAEPPPPPAEPVEPPVVAPEEPVAPPVEPPPSEPAEPVTPPLVPPTEPVAPPSVPQPPAGSENPDSPPPLPPPADPGAEPGTPSPPPSPPTAGGTGANANLPTTVRSALDQFSEAAGFRSAVVPPAPNGGGAAAPPAASPPVHPLCQERGFGPQACDTWIRSTYADKECHAAGKLTREACIAYLTELNGGVFPGCAQKTEAECQDHIDLSTTGYLPEAARQKADDLIKEATGSGVVPFVPELSPVPEGKVAKAKWWLSASVAQPGVSSHVVVVDSDGDGLPDDAETALGTDPENPDTDGDGVDDRSELIAGTDPLNPVGDARPLDPTLIAVVNHLPLEQPLGAAGQQDDRLELADPVAPPPRS